MCCVIRKKKERKKRKEKERYARVFVLLWFVQNIATFYIGYYELGVVKRIDSLKSKSRLHLMNE